MTRMRRGRLVTRILRRRLRRGLRRLARLPGGSLSDHLCVGVAIPADELVRMMSTLAGK